MSALPPDPVPQGDADSDRHDSGKSSEEVVQSVVGEHAPSVGAHQRGWYGMTCFNGLSRKQQHFLVHEGYLPFLEEPEGECLNGAEIEITTMHDLRSGPRFYCQACAVEHLRTLDPESEWLDIDESSSTVLHNDDVDVG